jgi:hypothetical protein
LSSWANDAPNIDTAAAIAARILIIGTSEFTIVMPESGIKTSQKDKSIAAEEAIINAFVAASMAGVIAAFS